MATCNDCLELLEHDQWQAKVIKRDILPLVLSTKHCSLCRFLCNFFEIPIDSILNRKAWPSAEQIGLTDDERGSLGLHRPGHRLEHFVGFRVIGAKSPVRRIWGELTLKGPGRAFPSPDSATLPLGKSSTYMDSETTLGVCMNSAGM
jgi:hypothetical protein